ncbi:MAG: cytochrome c oxidase subunit 3 [Isosphaeraceae bacterium]
MNPPMTSTAETRRADFPALSVQFDDLEQQHQASSLGMWMFLATEVMFFGGLIAAYVVYRSVSPREFAEASRHLKLWLGCVNTVVLLGSSLTMALAVRAAQLHDRRRLLRYLLATMLLGTAFLGIKAVEYSQEYHERLIPGLNFQLPEGGSPQAGPTPLGAQRFEMFFVLYFFMTGLHAIHLIIGIALVGLMAYLVWKDWFVGGAETHIDVTGLYWHFVDVVWVFLYPLLYLIDVRS